MNTLVGRAVIVASGVLITGIVIVLIGLLSIQEEERIEEEVKLRSRLERSGKDLEETRNNLISRMAEVAKLETDRDDARKRQQRLEKELDGLKAALGVGDASVDEAVAAVAKLETDRDNARKRQQRLEKELDRLKAVGSR